MQKNKETEIPTVQQGTNEDEICCVLPCNSNNIKVHRDFYRLHESTIEIAKVSKLLLTVDQGETSKFAGKTLAEIDLNGKWLRFILGLCGDSKIF